MINKKFCSARDYPVITFEGMGHEIFCFRTIECSRAGMAFTSLAKPSALQAQRCHAMLDAVAPAA
jgi:hypothetical protein